MNSNSRKISLIYLASLLFLPSLAFAQDEAASATPTAPEGFDYGFLLMCSTLVFIMQGGFCLLEMGLSRSKNSINIVMKNVLDFAAGTVGFFLIGFSLMFGYSQEGFIGLAEFGFSSEFSGDHPVWIFWLFQVMFATAAVTISSGAMAERTFFPGYLTYAFFATCFIYPILGHWAWGGAATDFGFGGGSGWLAEKGFMDFAGSTVVHAVGGAFALAGIIVVGPRRGRFAADGEARVFPGHSAPLTALGVFLLVFGWFGFNAGSALFPNASLGRIAVVTILSGACGLLGALVTHWLRNGWADMEISMNGLLGGLVGATASCAFVDPWAALPIGLVSGVLTALGGDLFLKLKLDDSVGAVPVHLFCGFWGTLAASIFNSDGAFKLIDVQLIGAIVIPVVAFVAAYVLFYIVDKTIGLRASDDAQSQGLDFAEHSATAYPDFVVNDTDNEEV